MSSWSSYRAAPSLDHLKQAQRDMSNFGAAVEQLLKQPAPQNEKRPPRRTSSGTRVRPATRYEEPPTQLEVARLVAAIKRASE